MKRRLTEPFGKAGLTVAILALVLAMVGGAYAASNNGGGKATASAKAKRGPKGPKGATGPTGPAGPAGPAGTNGTNGKDGAAGAKGENGTNGKNVVTATLNPGQGTPPCEEGGVSIEVEGSGTKKQVCNGEEGSPGSQGSQGPQGNPWTAGGTLPPSSASGCPCTETGAWALRQGPASERAAISFSIPLAAALDASHVHVSNQANFTDFDEAGPGTTGCTGSAAAPTAPSGHLCVYIGQELSVLVQEVEKASEELGGVDAAGGYVPVLLFETTSYVTGTWAVTG